jgi:ABC-type multidrug transport system fused ATPase/permease subunit
MEQGQVVEAGTGEELLARQGAYARLWNAAKHARSEAAHSSPSS